MANLTIGDITDELSPALPPDGDDNPAKQKQSSTCAQNMPPLTTSNNEITRTNKTGLDFFLQLEKSRVKFFASVKVTLPVENSHEEREEVHAVVLEKSMSGTPTAEDSQMTGKDNHSSSADEPDIGKGEMEAISDSDKSPTQHQTADAQNMCLQTCSSSNNNITEMNNKEGNLNLEIVVEISDVGTQEHESQKQTAELSVEKSTSNFKDKPHARRKEKTKECIFSCNQCGEKFNTLRKLCRHLDWHKGKMLKCELCETLLGSVASLRRHIKSHSLSIPDKRKAKKKNGTHKCHLCSKVFSIPDELQEHLEQSHKTGKLYACMICLKALASLQDLKEHAQHCHNSASEVFEDAEKQQKKSTKPRETFICDLCGKKFHGLSLLKFHLDFHNQDEAAKCKVCRNVIATRHDLLSHGEKPHECEFCQKRFSLSHFEDAEKQRKKLTKQRKMFICDLCGRKFRSSSLLKFHLNWHNQDEAAKCKVCRKVLATRNGLHIHMKIHHGEKPHECEFCQKRFFTSQNLKVHRRIHTGEKPYSCKKCSRSFTQMGNYKLHMKTHTGDHLSECKDCGKKFKNPIHFKNHQKLHSGERSFVCKRCGLCFIAHGSLLAHTKKHAADQNWVPKNVQKPIICDHCGKIFASKKSLMQHLESHPENRLFHVYSCKFCGISFITEYKLEVHEICHYPKNVQKMLRRRLKKKE